MIAKEILKEAFDSDLQVLEKAFQNDRELFKDVQDTISIYISMLYKTLIEKRIITIEKFQEDMKEAKDLMELNLREREKQNDR